MPKTQRAIAIAALLALSALGAPREAGAQTVTLTTSTTSISFADATPGRRR